MSEGPQRTGRPRRPAASPAPVTEPPLIEPPPAEPARPEAVPDDIGAHDAAQPVGRFRRRSLTLADGTSLVLNPSGSIDHVDEAGAIVRSWGTADPEWSRHAIRFGLSPQEPTVAPSRRGLGAVRPPRR